MCVIILDPGGKELDFSILERAVERNPDGWGLSAIIPAQGETARHIKVTKGFGFTGAKRAWKKYAGMKRVFHARIGTSGTKDIKNCHPFPAGQEDNHRWFFHNGTVSFPRLFEEYCDSWHFAKYLQGFSKTDKALHDAIAAYAKREHSRFVMVFDNDIWRYGEGWLERDGFFYSNASALANIKYYGNAQSGRGTYEGGLLDPEHGEVTCDSHVMGFHKDTKTGLWTNIKPESVISATPAINSNATSREIAGSKIWDHTTGGWIPWTPEGAAARRGGYYPGRPQAGTFREASSTSPATQGAKTVGTLGAAATSELDDIVTEMEARRSGRGRRREFDADNFPFGGYDPDDTDVEDDILAAWQDLIKKSMEPVVWMRSNIHRSEGWLFSWPSVKTFDYNKPGPNNGRTVTHRVKAAGSNSWLEVNYSDKGVHMGSESVAGPYPGGLIICSGKDTVMYDGTVLDIEDWREMVYEWYWPETFLSDLDDETDEEAAERLSEREVITVTTSIEGEEVIRVVTA